MAKPKFDFKQFFLDKGEKVAIVVGAVLMVFMFVLAGMAVATSASTDENANTISAKAKSIDAAIKSSSGEPPPVDPLIDGNIDYPQIPSYPTGFFVDLALDSAKRGSPTILAPTEFQVDLVRVPLLVYSLTGDGDNRKIHVLKAVAGVDKKNYNAKKLEERYGAKKRPTAPRPGAGGMPGGGMPGMPGMPSGPGGLGGGGGGMPGMPGGPGGFGGGMSGPRPEMGIESVLLKDFDPAKFQPAQFIRPARMVVIQGSFPFKKQLEEFQKALRYNSLIELVNSKADVPEFRGFNVERQIKTLDGSRVIQEWQPYDWLTAYKPIYVEKVFEDAPEDEKLKQYGIISDLKSRLVLPMPKLARGNYPRLDLPTIKDAVDALEKSGASDVYKPAGTDKLKGVGDPFGDADTPPGADPKKDEPTIQRLDVPDAVLIRFVDAGIFPGYMYEYRIRMVLANPNQGKDRLVGRPDYATAEKLVGPSVEVTYKSDGQSVSGVPVPLETIAYAYVAESRTFPRPEHTRVQVHAWLDHVRTDPTNRNAVDDVGEWVVEDLEVARGQLMNGTKSIKLPVWDPKSGQYQFKEMAKDKKPGSAAAQKGLVPVELASRTLLVDFEGGRSQQSIRGKTVVDDAAVEMLVIGPDGKLRVRNSIADKNNKERLDREDEWKKWGESVKTSDSKPGASDPFNKGGGAGGNKGKP